ncbi:MAG: hypothetical protein KBS57_02230 [Alistipes sp.]|nr:hypothetical protein [Candidatus Minthomonas equi]
MKRHIGYTLLTAALLLFSSCAVEKSESSVEISKKTFDSWLIENHYDHIKPTDVGIYILEDVPGTGSLVEDGMFIYVNQVQTKLDGTIYSHNNEDLAIRLGTWNKFARYTPTVWNTAKLDYGLRDMILGANITDNKGTGGMRVGGYRKAIIVPWIKNPYTGKEVASDGTSYIYDIEITDATNDIIQYQVDSLESFKRHYPGGVLADVDSTYFGFYAKCFPTTEVNDTIAINASISLWYIGRYLDGVIFDTNIKDTAKFYNIYNDSKSYNALSFTYARDSTSAVSNNNMVTGFSHAIRFTRNYGDHCKTFFTSDYGYNASGKDKIPGYEPLYFDIWIAPKKK